MDAWRSFSVSSPYDDDVLARLELLRRANEIKSSLVNLAYLLFLIF